MWNSLNDILKKSPGLMFGQWHVGLIFRADLKKGGGDLVLDGNLPFKNISFGFILAWDTVSENVWCVTSISHRSRLVFTVLQKLQSKL